MINRSVKYTIAAFYRFLSIAEPQALAAELRNLFQDSDLRGTSLIATEGINGTMAGSAETIDRLLAIFTEKVGLDRAEVKFTTSETEPFRKLRFAVKREIITFRQDVDPNQPGTYVRPEDWNELIAQHDVLVLDTRNSYETEVGTFEGAVLPQTASFSEFATYVRQNLDPAKHRKVAMFCTGGIRCEKASAFMLQEGFEEVYHLRGGILRYLEQVPEEQSKWQGQCYIFDKRMTVGREDFQ
ncbi:oxygen-dependent tRNA uridine(34) hydroxylase TrhO [Terriglobus albidus]|uniref:oxygen-dependent tRNA uridine(34) hydroxylase TrhO n=1 Tax=Terriglobus albidus TaxID=1592106 RepID=UPI0021E006DF|nr:rhodanese-related sulfurtransferase [Terriglobus albidus]